MPEELHTSFIPKAPINRSIKRSSPFSFLGVVIVLIFLASIGAWGYAYGMRELTKKQVTSLKLSLEEQIDAFEPKLLAEFERVDKKLKAAEELLGRHTVVTPLFSEIERATLPTVRYTAFAYRKAIESATHIVTMTGHARGYNAIALQSDALAENEYIDNPVFSGLGEGPNNSVTFNLGFSVDPRLFSYMEVMRAIDARMQGLEESPRITEEIIEEIPPEPPMATTTSTSTTP